MIEQLDNLIDVPVCIVGAGPAGMTAALALSKAGVASVLVEKAQFPRYKPSGNGLRPQIFQSLDQLVDRFSTRFYTECPHIPMNAIGVATANRRMVYDLPQSARMVVCTRYDFDNFLMAQVKERPDITVIENMAFEHAEHLEDGVLFSCNDGQARVKAQLAIIANGAHSKLAQQLTGTPPCEPFGRGIRRIYSGVALAADAQHPVVTYMQSLLPYFMFYTPLPNGLFSIGLTVGQKSGLTSQDSLRQELDRLVQAHFPDIGRKLAQATLKTEGFVWSPNPDAVTPISGKRFLLAGEAANLCDPLTFAGTDLAVASGMLAGQMAAAALSSAEFNAHSLSRYDIAIRQQYDRAFRRNKFMRERFLKLPYINAALAVSRYSSPLRNYFRQSTLTFGPR